MKFQCPSVIEAAAGPRACLSNWQRVAGDTRASWQRSRSVPSAARRSFFNRVITWLQLMAAPMAGQTLLSHNIKPSLRRCSPHPPHSISLLSPACHVPLRTRLWLRFNLQWTLFFARFLVVCGLKVFSAAFF